MYRTDVQRASRLAVARRVEPEDGAVPAADGAVSTRATGIVVADSHPVVLAGLGQLCLQSWWLRLAAAVRTGAEAIAAVRENQPQLVVMDTWFPDLAAFDLIRHLRALVPAIRIVLFTADAARAAHTAAANDAVVAVVHKRTDLADLERLLRRVADGERLVPAGPGAGGSKRSGRVPGGLTAREHEILRKVASGMTNVEIAQELGLTHNTIKTYFQRTLEKLGARNRVEAVLRADEKGLL